jgi:hypothetical protein
MSTNAPTGQTERLAEDRIPAFHREREYLEKLLSTRLNFFMVFASLLLVGLSADGVSSEQRRAGFTIGVIVSALIFLSVWRTHRLIDYVLKQLTTVEQYPYTEARKSLEGRWVSRVIQNANVAFASMPALIAILFFVLLLMA